MPSTSNDALHGTPVLGAAQASNNSLGTVGVAPDAVARIMKIYDPIDQDWEVNAAIAIDDNASHATVMSISYSTKITSSTPPSSFTGLHDAIINAYYQHNVLFTASTGNQSQSGYYAFPANFDEVIGVGGSNKDDNHIYNIYAPGNVEISAPAEDILTVCEGGSVGEFDGTSFSTPMVAGAIMLMRAKDPNWGNDAIRNRLKATAIWMGNVNKSGSGRIDVKAALALYVFIDGPDYVDSGQEAVWQSSASGNSGPVSYQWYYRESANGPWINSNVTTQSFTHTFNNQDSSAKDAAVKVVVSSNGETANDIQNVTVGAEGGCIKCF